MDRRRGLGDEEHDRADGHEAVQELLTHVDHLPFWECAAWSSELLLRSSCALRARRSVPCDKRGVCGRAQSPDRAETEGSAAQRYRRMRGVEYHRFGRAAAGDDDRVESSSAETTSALSQKSLFARSSIFDGSAR